MNSSVPSGYSNMPMDSIVRPGNGLRAGNSSTFITMTFFLYVSVILIIVPLKPLKDMRLPSLKNDAIILSLKINLIVNEFLFYYLHLQKYVLIVYQPYKHYRLRVYEIALLPLGIEICNPYLSL